ncbi:MAG: hypothetical protein HKN59_02445 [Gammaproteobacteria bacterium]|nr:hypothetical protein [Gammaproteobacteria bacterium]
MLSRFLEISLHSPDILTSLDFYRGLGFKELLTSDAHPHPYAVTSDGRACIGLHQRAADAPVISFVVPELAAVVARGLPEGLEPIYTRLGEDDFHEAGFVDGDGHVLTFLEARTFSPPAFGSDETSLLGYFEGIVLPSSDLDTAAARWESLGFVALDDPESSAGSVLLTSDALNVHLRDRAQNREPALLFSGPDLEARIALLKQRDFAFEQEIPGKRGACLKTPEGLAIRLLGDS